MRGVWQGPPLMGLAVSGRSAPHLGARVQPVCAMSDAVFIEYLSSIGGTPGEVLRQPELMALLMPMLRADFRMVDDYQPPASPLGLQCPMIAFYGVDDPATPADRMAAWSAYGAEGFRLEALPGGHFFLEPERAAILARMGLAA